ncbi:HAD family hydrolase [Rhizobacter sp. SG703]|uniref:HAD family hydrolase n=1 Tax=Rhizobacter sp. SG703 TaxID=2587140 RepID=UPI001446F0EF|nr:HAD family hydrolase [Rhizobacter sp. SG703]NKI97582.1 HAD superfamily hydrolase (TIGR01509 family) [Rhizobacter sp. SG703]
MTKLVIFDLDDTLIDFASTRLVAHDLIAEVLADEGIAVAPFLQACVEVDRPLFVQFEQGRLTRQEYRMRRFADPFDRLGLTPREGLVAQLNRVFMDCVNDSPRLYDDARPTLARLRGDGLQLAILTNGPADGQRRKLVATGLDDAVDHVAIGEEAGVSKPHPQAYLRVCERLGVAPAQCLMVGDSLALDYQGALAAGLQAVLLDRAGAHVGTAHRMVRDLHGVRVGSDG